MALVKISDYYSNYQDNNRNFYDIKNYNVYANNSEKIGVVNEILVDDSNGNFRYLVINTGFWVFGKKVLLPIGSAEIHHTENKYIPKV
ncbi:MAG: PRC-barrel domain containing protein [Richelia sp. SM1_7_0]|nr:PRC-barrel domain containing protein [Richelia sp. SM1_7_0]